MTDHSDDGRGDLTDLALHPGAVPDTIVTQARLALLDAVGCAIAGSQLPSGRALARWVATQPGPSRVLGLGLGAPPALAAFAGAQLINAMDFDPVSSAGHDVPAIVASALVAVERAQGNGQDLLEAIAIGLEVSTRLAVRNRQLAAGPQGEDIRYVGNPLFAPAIVATVARASGLSAAQCRHGLALAAWMRPTDTVADYFAATTVSMAKYGLFGQLAQIGLTAADLARSGFTGPASVFADDSQLWRVGASRAWPGFPGADTAWRHRVRHKLLPTNLPTIAIKAAFGELLTRRALGPDDISRIVVQTGDLGQHAVMVANQLLTSEDAILHVPYQLACLTLRIPRIAWLDPDTADRADVRHVMGRVELRPGSGGVRIEVVTPQGVWTVTASESDGTLVAPGLDGADTLVTKFIECTEPVLGASGAGALASQLLTISSADRLDTLSLGSR
jgi:2-methylcitrate dehydratase PrpD